MGNLNETLKREWEDLPVVDATEPLRVTIVESDIVTAKRKSPGCCAFANACKRSFGSSKVLFYRSVAYVEMADENGDSRVERFTLSGAAKKFVSDFDKGKLVSTGGFTLNVARPSERLQSLSKKARAERAAQKRLAIKSAKTKTGKKPSPVVFATSLVRTGKGAVHFAKTKARPASA
jgi:hypothetical protein